MSDETAQTVTPAEGLRVLEGAKSGIYVAFEGQGDSPASAIPTALTGYRNALREITQLQAQNRELVAVLGRLRLHRLQLEEEPVPSELLSREDHCLQHLDRDESLEA